MKKITALALVLIFATILHAQTSNTTASDNNKKHYPKNDVKVNVPGIILFNNYTFSYERLLSRKISVTGSYRFMPAKAVTSTTLGKKIADAFSTDDASDYDKITASDKAYTLEFRLYGGKHPGARGFYIALYGRYADFNIYYPYDFYSETNAYYLIPLNTKLHGIGGGMGFGAQWLIAKRVTLDWTVLGSHYGSLKGNATGAADLSSLSEKDKHDLQDDINSIINVSGKNYITSAVTPAGVQATVKAPFIGIKAGISIGISF